MMEKTANEPRSLILSTHLYRVLLAIYPFEFRQAYGSPMLQVFRDCCRRALGDAGPAGLLALWARTLLDTVQTALEEHVQRGVDMSKEKFIKLSGWALMLGGLALTLGFLAGTRPEYNQFNARSLPIDRYANAIEGPLSVMAMFLLAVGFTGLFLQYRRQAGSFGQASLGLSALSGVVGAVGSLGLFIVGNEPWWSIFFFGLIFEFVGLALFGMANLRQRIMPRWNVLPLLAGMWVPLYVLASLLIEQSRGSWAQAPLLVDLAMFLLTAAGLVGLGYVLQAEPPKSTVTSATAV
jgi:hypothetical protein